MIILYHWITNIDIFHVNLTLEAFLFNIKYITRKLILVYVHCTCNSQYCCSQVNIKHKTSVVKHISSYELH